MSVTAPQRDIADDNASKDLDVRPVPADERAFLALEDVAKGYPTPAGRLDVLSGVGLTISPGTSVALTGESGSGKSTLLHLVAGLDTVDRGRILLEGRDIAQMREADRAELRRSRLGIVFQQFNLIPSLSVGDNLSFQARLADRYDAEWCAHLAERLGIDAALDRYPEQLSGGQQQRLAIGRALAARPALLLADEPTGNLDEATAEGVMALALDLVAETGCAFLMVTHSPALAERLDRRVHLTGGRLTARPAVA
ncbi:MAG: ABC transporter ATP-binding protein [Pseudomonadota bacterium]